MRKIVESDSNAFDSLLGKKIVVYACRFIYTGILEACDNTTLLLKDAKIVYDTGEHTSPKKAWANVEPCWSSDWHVQIASIESFGLSPF
jgi:hypothetical protein